MLDQIRIVLVNTTHPGNIGSAARAMKTMGLTQLYLVSPVQFPDPQAHALAAGATDILEKAIVVPTLNQAIADCALVVGTSARMRRIPWPLLMPHELAVKIKEEPSDSQVAILFGNEQSGLTNEELEHCQLHVQIPANPEYSSLNLAAAVQIIAYELRITLLDQVSTRDAWDYRLATAEELALFFKHLEEVLITIDFLNLKAPRKLMTRLRRLFFRTRIDVMEMNILRGMLNAIQEAIKHARVGY